MVRNPFFRQFRVIKIFAFPSYQGTHPLIESLRQRLKSTELQLTFIARLPLLGEKSFVMVNGVEEIVFVVNEDELNGLLIEYLM